MYFKYKMEYGECSDKVLLRYRLGEAYFFD